jgi:4-amino-4-deoxy-L-arabinose transferase-like glycosyltransferase
VKNNWYFFSKISILYIHKWSLFFLFILGKDITVSSKSQRFSLYACCNLVPLRFRVRFQKLKMLRYLF